MRDLSGEEVDFCIVGAGAGGGVLGAKIAEAGFSVVILDAGPHWNPVKDFVSDEIASRALFWTATKLQRLVGLNAIALEHRFNLGVSLVVPLYR